ncbi:MAG: DUF6226 family protein [Ilumatobacter sp.]|uniref:DUF6226 family protein n=1 Tax=Ilumatobacter sp. TaxID=1967498 RepID=UPI003C713582
MRREELIAEVVAEFETISAGMERWPDPHPTGEILDEEYSRTTNPARFRIIGARCEAWLKVLVDRGLCSVERDVEVVWADPPSIATSGQDRAVPSVVEALPLVVRRTQHAVLGDFGVRLGIGSPVEHLGAMPRCGCDACDGGSEYELDEVDRAFFVVVSGALRRLTRQDRLITVEDNGWSASGRFDRGEVETILADSTGWAEVSGAPWGVGG